MVLLLQSASAGRMLEDSSAMFRMTEGVNRKQGRPEGCPCCKPLAKLISALVRFWGKFWCFRKDTLVLQQNDEQDATIAQDPVDKRVGQGNPTICLTS